MAARTAGALWLDKVVHDDHVATGEFGHEDAADAGEERVGIHRPVERPRRDHAGAAQAGREGSRLPVTEGNAGAQALAPPATAMPPRHVGAGPGFVEEDQSRRVAVELAIEPLFALLQDVGAILLARVPGLFCA